MTRISDKALKVLALVMLGKASSIGGIWFAGFMRGTLVGIAWVLLGMALGFYS